MTSESSPVKYLYRYQQIDKLFLRSLKKSYQWFSNPLTFNDPYDCNLNRGLLLEHDKGLMFQHYKSYNNELKLNRSTFFSDRELMERVEEMYNDSDALYKRVYDAIKKHIQELGICCFSKSDDILLMWSHYSDKHSGICLKFDVDKDPDFFFVLYEVVYSKEFPIYNYYQDVKQKGYRGPTRLRYHSIATKSSDWVYEEEVRVVKDVSHGKYRGEIGFKKEALVEVVFGYNTKEKDINSVIDLLRKNNYTASFYKMKLKENDYGLIKEPYIYHQPKSFFKKLFP